MSIRSFFDQASYNLYDIPDVGHYDGIVRSGQFVRGLLVAQQIECSRTNNCINNAIMGFPAGDGFLMEAMIDVVRLKFKAG